MSKSKIRHLFDGIRLSLNRTDSQLSINYIIQINHFTTHNYRESSIEQRIMQNKANFRKVK